jgi:LEA14-like dessication related protein
MRIRNNSPVRSLFALFLLALTLGACSRAVRQPEVRLEGVRVGGVGLRGGTIYAQVLVTNPNGFDLETEQLTYDLQVADPKDASQWISFSKGVIDERIRIDDHDSKVIEVPIQFRYDDFGGALRSIIDTGTFNYRVTGGVKLTGPLGRTIPFSKTGIVSMAGVR